MAAFATVGTAAYAHEPVQAAKIQDPTIVQHSGDIRAGEIHVDPDNFVLYWTLPDQRAIAYPIGVGRAGLYESGRFFVGAKREWPRWTPTPDMIEREPEQYAQFADGVAGGPENPLGARALYLHTSRGADSLLRIHGTNEPGTIGQAISNGCARLINRQIVDLYTRVPLDTPVILYPKRNSRES